MPALRFDKAARIARDEQRDILEAVTLPCLAALLAHQKQPEGLEGMSRAAFLS